MAATSAATSRLDWLMEPNRPDALGASVAELLDDPARRATMGAYNRQRFLQRMAWEYSAGELLAAYETLCPKPVA